MPEGELVRITQGSLGGGGLGQASLRRKKIDSGNARTKTFPFPHPVGGSIENKKEATSW